MKEKNESVFVDVEALSVGFSEFRLPQTTDLVGKKFELNYEEGYSVTFDIYSENTLKATYKNGNDVEEVGAIYTAVMSKPGIYFIDFIWSYGYTKSISTVLDLNQSIALTCVGILPTQKEADISVYNRFMQKIPLTSVKADFSHAAINTPFTNKTKKHKRTNHLVGQRLQFTYSNNDIYEHVYLNENFYTWHCLKGIEVGLCDTDKCNYFDLGSNLIWFVWQEKIVPTLGSVIEDFDAMRSYGKLYGYKNSIDEQYVINFPVGSYAKILNKTEYSL